MKFSHLMQGQLEEHECRLFTTLPDVRLYSAQALGELCFRRRPLEVFDRDIKQPSFKWAMDALRQWRPLSEATPGGPA